MRPSVQSLVLKGKSQVEKAEDVQGMESTQGFVIVLRQVPKTASWCPQPSRDESFLEAALSEKGPRDHGKPQVMGPPVHTAELDPTGMCVVHSGLL